VQSRADRLSAAVDLYRALGGGWDQSRSRAVGPVSSLQIGENFNGPEASDRPGAQPLGSPTGKR